MHPFIGPFSWGHGNDGARYLDRNPSFMDVTRSAERAVGVWWSSFTAECLHAWEVCLVREARQAWLPRLAAWDPAFLPTGFVA